MPQAGHFVRGKGCRAMSENSSEPGFETKVRKPLVTAGRIVGTLIILALCTGGYFIYNSLAKKDATYLTMSVGKGSILDKVQGTGNVMPLHEVDLYFKQQGTLKLLNVRSGDEVQAVQVLAVQDNSVLQAGLEQARSNLALAQYKLQQSQLDLEKAQETTQNQDAMYKAGALAKSDWDQSQRDYTNAQIIVKSDQASVQTAQAKVVIAETDLKNAELTAPFSGVAAQVNGEVGQETGNSSSPMFHLISNELKIVVMVNEVDIGRVQLNQDVIFNVSSYPNRPFQGKVSRISPQAATTNNIQLYEVDIATQGLSNQLRAGMSVTANIIINQRSDVAVVPNIAFSYLQTYLVSQGSGASSASTSNSSQRTGQYRNNSGNAGSSNNSPGNGLGRTGVGANATGSQNNAALKWSQNGSQLNNERRVVVLQDGKPVIKSIKVGMNDSQNTEVISGLQPGDQVIIGTNASSSNNASNSSASAQRTGSQQQRMTVGGFGGMRRD